MFHQGIALATSFSRQGLHQVGVHIIEIGAMLWIAVKGVGPTAGDLFLCHQLCKLLQFGLGDAPFLCWDTAVKSSGGLEIHGLSLELATVQAA